MERRKKKEELEGQGEKEGKKELEGGEVRSEKKRGSCR
jgi:hypothetical protein